jgi:hypothetical protein
VQQQQQQQLVGHIFLQHEQHSLQIILVTAEQAPGFDESSLANICIVRALSSAMRVLSFGGQCHCGRGGHVYM